MISPLKQEALALEKELGILTYLSNYGKASIVGSVATDLIVTKDLDIHLLTPHNLLHIKSLLCKYIKAHFPSLRVYTEDLRTTKSSVYVNITSYKSWNIDIWLTNSITYTGFALAHELNLHLTSEDRKLILFLKQYYAQQHLLHNEMSTLIYKAVLYEHINSLDEFQIYLSTLPPNKSN